MNITDIGHLTGDADDGEDKMLKTAQERHQSVMEIAQFYTDAFIKDIDRLNIRHPDVICRATEHVQEMIELIKKIEANGHTYMAGGNLYYDTTTFADYGKLANLNLEELKAGAGNRGLDENKRNPTDFVLWFTKSKFENQALTWDSPWGRGYPGWHIECSAMSMKYLGEQFDIHTGGIDHIPVHHTNEIAQSEGATGKKWVNYWLHNEFLVEKNGKMSKSSGEFLTLQRLIDKGYEALDYRYFLLGAHYRSQVMFSWEAMDSAKNGRKALVNRAKKVLEAAGGRTADENSLSEKAKGYLDSFKADLENDLATPQALSRLQVAVKDNELKAEDALFLIKKMDSVLALDLLKEAESSGTPDAELNSTDPEAAQIEQLLLQRTQAKKDKDFALADKIRDDLAAKGIIIVDTPTGPTWKRK